MAQTTTAIAQGRALVSFSTDGATWVDASGSLASVDPGTVEQLVGTQHTQGADAAVVVASGKIDPSETTIRGVWTVTANEAWDLLYTEWDATGAKRIYFKYSPEGGQSGDIEYLAADDAGNAFDCPIKSLTYPAIDESGDVIAFECVLTVPKYVDATVA